MFRPGKQESWRHPLPPEQQALAVSGKLWDLPKLTKNWLFLV
jgi:hypothetical protein